MNESARIPMIARSRIGNAVAHRAQRRNCSVKEAGMTIEVTQIKRLYRYNGISLPDVPGLSAKEVRDLYSAQYPELVSAEIETGEIRDGVQEITFKRAVGTKG
jgi:PRTRC genetic system protein C